MICRKATQARGQANKHIMTCWIKPAQSNKCK